MTREVKVELLKPWSMVSIRYRSTAYRLRSSGTAPVIMYR